MNEDLFQLGIKALITNHAGKYLVLKVDTAHYKVAVEPFWDIPGGRIQRGETVEEALMREVTEEIGAQKFESVEPFAMVIANFRVPLKDGSDVGLILKVLKVRIADESQITLSEEHLELEWVDANTAADRLYFKYPEEFTSLLRG